VIAHAQKPDFVFRRNERVHLNRRGGVSSVDYWQASCGHQPARFVLLVQACVLQSCDTYWLPTPFSRFPFTSPPVRHRVPSYFNWTLLGASHVKLHSREAILMCKHFDTSGKGPLKFKGLPYLLESSSIDPFLFFACSLCAPHPSFLLLVCFSLQRCSKLHLRPSYGTDSSSLHVTHRN